MDTKLEFGMYGKTRKVMLIDEAFTPDSSRYAYEEPDGTIKETIKELVRQRYKGKPIPEEASKEDLKCANELSKEYKKLCNLICTIS